MPDTTAIRLDYAHRATPEYYADTEQQTESIVYQPEVYAHAADVARALGATRIVDYGCGRAGKLSELAAQFEVVGIDYGSNIEWCQQAYDFGTWIEDDFDDPAPVDVDTTASVVICSDVIEHVKHPDVLAGKLREAMANGAAAVLISTPERELTHGLWHSGPPRNPTHVREWTTRELMAFLRRAGFEHGSVGLTRSNTVQNGPHTILCAYVADPAALPLLEDTLIDATRPQAPIEPNSSFVARVRRRVAQMIAAD